MLRSLSALVLSLLAACQTVYPSAEIDRRPRVALVPAGVPAAETRREVLAVAEPGQDAMLAMMRPGRVVARVALVGARLQEGDPILRLDDVEARAGVRLAEAGLAEAEAVRAEAGRALERVAALGDGAADAQREAAETAWARAEAALLRAQAQRDLARADLAHHSLLAPFDGALSWLDPDVGETVAAGAPVARVVSVDRTRVVVGLHADEVTRAARGRFVVKAGEVEAEGTLVSIADAADPRTFDWRAEIALSGVPFPLGAAVRVEVALPSEVEGVVVPPSAVHQDAVWVVHERVARRVAVERVGEDDDGVVVRGLEAGAAVVVHGAAALTDGAEVVVVGARP